jgi:SAM-dependent methyltransferase
LYEAVDSEYRRQILDVLPREPALTLLDIGCDDGLWTERLQHRMGIPPTNVSGIEIVPERRKLAEGRQFDVRDGDLEAPWPFEDSTFDVVHANQVIEHVKRLDHFVRETRRVLRPGGIAVVCTENLASWHNVAALALGFMPFSLTNISDTGPIGNPLALHVGEVLQQGESWQHVHVLTLPALCRILDVHGLIVERRFASGYYPAVGRVAKVLASIDPRHAHFIGVVARKGRAERSLTQA